MNSIKRTTRAAELILRDEKGQPNIQALEVYNQKYFTARYDGLTVQAAAELALIKALGGKVP